MTPEFALCAMPGTKGCLKLHIRAWSAARSWTFEGYCRFARLPIGEIE